MRCGFCVSGSIFLIGMQNIRTGLNSLNTCLYFRALPAALQAITGRSYARQRSVALDYEGEVAIIIGKAGRRISQENAYDHIAALTICNEGTIRDWVRHAKFNVTQGKNWDKSGAMGPWLVPFREASQLDDARIITRVNGEVRQDDVLSRMMFSIRHEIEYISSFMTLLPGDIIVTGTPTGAGEHVLTRRAISCRVMWLR